MLNPARTVRLVGADSGLQTGGWCSTWLPRRPATVSTCNSPASPFMSPLLASPPISGTNTLFPRAGLDLVHLTRPPPPPSSLRPTCTTPRWKRRQGNGVALEVQTSAVDFCHSKLPNAVRVKNMPTTKGGGEGGGGGGGWGWERWLPWETGLSVCGRLKPVCERSAAEKQLWNQFDGRKKKRGGSSNHIRPCPLPLPDPPTAHFLDPHSPVAMASGGKCCIDLTLENNLTCYNAAY